jgi:MtN3 and saliva related transmembrane protein
MTPENITLVVVVGIVVAIMSALSKIIGFPDQIRKIYQRKSTEGLSLIFYSISFTTYLLWAIYGGLRGDWVVMIAHGTLGCITTGIILYQFFLYRNNK